MAAVAKAQAAGSARAKASHSVLRSGAAIDASSKSAKSAQRAAAKAANAIFSAGSPSSAAAAAEALVERCDIELLKRKRLSYEATEAAKVLAQQCLAEKAQHHMALALSLLSQLAARMSDEQLDELFAPLAEPARGDVVKVYGGGGGSQFKYCVMLCEERARVFERGAGWRKLRFSGAAVDEVVVAAAVGKAVVKAEIQLLLGKVDVKGLCRKPRAVDLGGSACARKAFCGSVPHYAYRKARNHVRLHGAGAVVPQQGQHQRNAARERGSSPSPSSSSRALWWRRRATRTWAGASRTTAATSAAACTRRWRGRWGRST